ncbi:hypothetical protein ASG47_04895 [Devosia sp. Leaf420]|uniref:hypothetical protein n=1 Tax=Devosia sp. Leaf420 TaxID=1736374 RepID=UPI00071567AF|nr:hypothetical protein [Devosia sp. Leaf420]KQT49655.1 hypothetical protein ASG47_04895 [Devosia sp. Leaf420]
MRWGFLESLVSIAAIAAVGGGIYAWGAGWFWPCETLGLMFNNGACQKVAHFDARNIGPFGLLPNGNILVASLPGEDNSSDPLALVEIDAKSGEAIHSTLVNDLQPEASVTNMAVSPDGQTVALSFIHNKTHVISRDGGTILRTVDRWFPRYLSFDKSGWLLTDMGTDPTGLPDPNHAEGWPIASNNEDPVPANVADTAGLYSHGIETALSPDGRTYAQKIDQLRDSAVTGIRIGSVDDPAYAGTLYGLTLRDGCTYASSQISFSPFGKQVAAEFSCPERWGKTASALAVWDYETGKTLLILPTIDYFSSIVWESADTILTDRYNFGPETNDILRIKVPAAE